MKVLIAEDDKFTRDGLAELLRGEGYRVVAVADGVQAVAEFQNQQPDFVCLDVIHQCEIRRNGSLGWF